MKKILAFVVIAVALPFVAHAADQSDGCGVGWYVTQKLSLSATTTRGTTNAFLPNTFSMTSGTSGCAPHSLVKRDDVPAFEFARDNYDALTIQMAQGNGEVLTAFAHALGCGDAAVASFGKMIQSHYAEIVGESELSPVDLFGNVKDQVRSDQVLALACRS